MATFGAFFDARALPFRAAQLPHASGIDGYLPCSLVCPSSRGMDAQSPQEPPDLSRGNLERTRQLMEQALPDALVTGYEHLIDSIELPDRDDRHVLAAAVRCGASVIVTLNLGDFPSESLATPLSRPPLAPLEAWRGGKESESRTRPIVIQHGMKRGSHLVSKVILDMLEQARQGPCERQVRPPSSSL